MQRVTFINTRGESIELHHSPFFLNNITGLGDVEADIQNQKAPGQDGTTNVNIVLNERYIPIEVVILEKLQANRQLISRVFNPKLGAGLLIYENDTTTRKILAIPEHVPKFDDIRPRKEEIVTIDLVCPNPYWLSNDNVSQMTTWEGGLTFPLRLPTKLARRSLTKTKLVLNEGDVETPLTIVFSGPATAPIRVENLTSGKYIEVNQSLDVGERMEINTAFGQKRVEKVLPDGTRFNAFHYIKRGSKLFDLVSGNNLLNYSTGEEYERAAVTMIWNDRYLGV